MPARHLRTRLTFTMATMLSVIAGAASAAEPLVDIGWLKTNLGKPGMVVLDARFSGDAGRQAFAAGHIPGSVFTDYSKDGWRVKAGDVAGMLAPVDKLETLVGRLGIDNHTHVIVAAAGNSAADMGNATRIYWTFKVLGHDEVSVLDGGFAAWVAERNPTTKQPVYPLATGSSQPAAKEFKAAFRPHMIADAKDVQTAMAAGTPLIDNRPHDFYMGLTKSSAAKTAGTLAGARNMPEGWLTQNGGGKFRPRSELAKLYAHASVPTAGAQINFCNTGHWASLGWFVSSELLGNKAAKMYDGSMAEWTQDASRPVHRQVKLD